MPLFTRHFYQILILYYSHTNLTICWFQSNEWVSISTAMSTRFMFDRTWVFANAGAYASIHYTTTLKTKTNINCKQYLNIDKLTHIRYDMYIYEAKAKAETETEPDVAGQMSSFFWSLMTWLFFSIANNIYGRYKLKAGNLQLR